MKLQDVQGAIDDCLADQGLFGIYKNTDTHNVLWQRLGDGLGLLDCDMAGTVLIKHQSNRVRARFSRGQCICLAGDAANFNGDTHLSIPPQAELAAIPNAALDIALLELLLRGLAIHTFGCLESPNRLATLSKSLELVVTLRLALRPCFPELVLLHLPKSLTDLVGDALWSEMPETYLRWMMAKSLAARIVYREGFEYLETMEDADLAGLALRYLDLEEERENLTAEILESDLQYKDRVAALLHDAGIFSTMGRHHIQ